MPTPATQPDTPNPVGGNALKTGFGSLTHTQGLQKMVTDIANIWAKVGNGAANQVASAAGAGRFVITKLDGTTELLPLHLFSSVLNPSMERWERATALGATSIAVPASTSGTAGYGPDRWCLKTNASQASHWTRGAGLTDGSQYAAKVGRDSGQTGILTMIAEQAYDLSEIIKHRNDYLCIAPVVKAGANWSPTSGNLTVKVTCGTGSVARLGAGAYTSPTVIINQTVAVTAGGSAVTLGPFVSTVVVPTNTTQMSVSFEWTPVGTAGAADDVTIDDVMVNKGTVPMPYRARPDDEYQCLKYFTLEGGGAYYIDYEGSANGAHTIVFPRTHKVQMRIAPTVTKVGTWTVVNCGQPSVDIPTINGYRIYITASAAGAWSFRTNDATMYVTNDAEI